MSDELKEYQVGPLVFRLVSEDAKERGLSAADLVLSKRRKAPANKTSAAASKDADDAADSADGTD